MANIFLVIIAFIDNELVAVFGKTVLFGNFSSYDHEITKESLVACCGLADGGQALSELRDHGDLIFWLYVSFFKCHAFLILIQYLLSFSHFPINDLIVQGDIIRVILDQLIELVNLYRLNPSLFFE